MVGILSDIGNIRKSNQDSVAFYEDTYKKIYVVADGMGGYNGGEIASKIAVDETIGFIKNVNESDNWEEVLINAIKHANNKIYDTAINSEELNGMGTTITTCFIDTKDNAAIIANVGDSSCFMLKDKKLIKITKDHSLVQQLLDNGSITEEEAMYHPNKNIITRALGTNRFVEVDIFKIDLSEAEKFVLCTDGLTNSISIDDMCDIILKNDNKVACEKLIELSKQKDGRDNISVIVI